MQIIVDDLLVTYCTGGGGKVVLWLHGWGDDMRSATPFLKELGQNYTIVALDLPGFGNTQPPKTAWNLDNYAAFVQHFLQKLKLEPYAIIGHSNGGAVALRGISLGLLKPRRLVLLAAAGIRNRQSVRRVGLKTIAKTGKLATLWLPKTYRQRLRAYLYGAAGSDMLIAEQLEETFKKTVRQDVQSDAAQVNLPVLMIYGENDTDTPPSDGRRYHELIKQSKLVVLPHAGHFIYIDAQDQVLAGIREFLT